VSRPAQGRTSFRARTVAPAGLATARQVGRKIPPAAADITGVTTNTVTQPASMPAHTSERILAPMRRLMAGRTTILISHDLLTVTDAQQILYLDRGRITETGTHTELLGRNGRYADLYRLRHPAASPAAAAAAELPQGLVT
jgi:hypothetical protein